MKRTWLSISRKSASPLWQKFRWRQARQNLKRCRTERTKSECVIGCGPSPLSAGSRAFWKTWPPAHQPAPRRAAVAQEGGNNFKTSWQTFIICLFLAAGTQPYSCLGILLIFTIPNRDEREHHQLVVENYDRGDQNRRAKEGRDRGYSCQRRSQ